MGSSVGMYLIYVIYYYSNYNNLTMRLDSPNFHEAKKRDATTAVPHNCYEDASNTIITVITWYGAANGHEIPEQRSCHTRGQICREHI